jgi:hypothetical protein
MREASHAYSIMVNVHECPATDNLHNLAKISAFISTDRLANTVSANQALLAVLVSSLASIKVTKQC